MAKSKKINRYLTSKDFRPKDRQLSSKTITRWNTTLRALLHKNLTGKVRIRMTRDRLRAMEAIKILKTITLISSTRRLFTCRKCCLSELKTFAPRQVSITTAARCSSGSTKINKACTSNVLRNSWTPTAHFSG